MRLGPFLRQHQSAVLARWEEATHRLPGAQPLPREEYLDNIPGLLEQVAEIAEAALQGEERVLHQGNATEHALHRLVAGYDLRDVVAEYAILRDAVLATWDAEVKVRMDVADITVLNRALDSATATSVDRYLEARERTLRALDNIALAMLDRKNITTNLDVTLATLARALIETSPGVDSIVILLKEEDTLRVRAAVGLEAEADYGFTIKIGEGFSGTIAATRQPLLLHDAARDPLVLSPFLREHGTKALYGVPLVERDEIIGVAHMGSRQASDFSETDKLVFRAMAIRASAFIVQAQLYEQLRQREEAHRQIAVEYARQARIFDTLASSLPDFLYLFDREKRFLYANQPLLTAWGLTAEQTIGKTMGELNYPPEHVERYERELDEVLRGQIVRGETSVPAVPGPQFVDYVFAPVVGADGQVEAIAGVTRDITERKRAAEEVQKLASVVEHSTDFIGLATREGRMLYVNPAGRRLVGLTADEDITKRSVTDFFPEEEARDIHERIWPIVFREGKWSGEQHYRHFRTGALIPVHRSAFLVRDRRTGEPLALASISRDITQRRREEDEAKRRAEVEQYLIGIVSHDLRSPISAILLKNQMLLRRTDLDDRTRQAVVTTVRSAERANRMIQDLLDFTRVRAGGGIPIARALIDVHDVIDATVDEVRASFAKQEIRLEQSGSGEGEWDPDRIAQVVTNLLRNALTYGDVTRPVRVTVRGDGGEVVLTIHNEGEPIPPEKLHRIFEPMQRGTTAGQERRNLGLGLYIVSAIVQAHGGRIEVESTREQGTTFTVQLPRRAPA